MREYDKFKEICNEIDVLMEQKVTKSSPQFRAWHSKAEHF